MDSRPERLQGLSNIIKTFNAKIVPGYKGRLRHVGKAGAEHRIKVGHAWCLLAFSNTVRDYLSKSTKDFLLILEDDVRMFVNEPDLMLKPFEDYTEIGDFQKLLGYGYFIPHCLLQAPNNHWQNIYSWQITKNLYMAKGLVDAHANLYPREMLESYREILPTNEKQAIDFIFYHRPYDLWLGLFGQYYSRPMIFYQVNNFSDTENNPSGKSKYLYMHVKDDIESSSFCLMQSGPNGIKYYDK